MFLYLLANQVLVVGVLHLKHCELFHTNIPDIHAGKVIFVSRVGGLSLSFCLLSAAAGPINIKLYKAI